MQNYVIATCSTSDLSVEYLKARNIALKTTIDVDIDKINQRIDDMKLRVDAESFEELVGKYDNN